MERAVEEATEEEDKSVGDSNSEDESVIVDLHFAMALEIKLIW